jgi:transmembrane sensor
MGQVSAHREEELLVAERAADWLRRLDTANAAERAGFVAWLKESPRHVREILLATTWDKVLDKLDSQRHVNLDALIAQGANDVVRLKAAPSTPSTDGAAKARWRYRRIAGLAAACAVIAVLAIWVPLKMSGHTYATAIGEQRTFELQDGSTIYLNADSRVKVGFSHGVRDAYLVDGQAIFKVKHDAARPFRVHVNGAFIQAVGTQFDVHRLTDQVNVAVIEGRVNISAEEKGRPGPTGTLQAAGVATLAAGETASIISSGKITRPAPVDVADATAWRHRRLVFRKQTLADMALEFNRYNHEPQIRIEGEAIQARQFNGVFDADDPESLIRFLESSDGIAVDRNEGKIVIRAR